MAKKFDPTPEQDKAIGHAHNKPAIVAAAAGSGKTTLLVERVVRILSDASLEISADHLAIMTFTKNATKSMREKLNRGLTEKLETLASSDDDADREAYDYLKKQIFLLRQAAISTIDAFCLRMIKENAEQFDLPLNFTIADSAKKAAMQSQAMKAALEELYSGDFSDAERDALFFSFSFENDSALEDALLSVAEKLSCYPDPEKWISDTLAVYEDLNSVETSFLDLLNDYLDFNIKRAKSFAAIYSEEKIFENFAEDAAKKKKAKSKKKDDENKSEENKDDIVELMEKYISVDEMRVNALVDDYKAYESNRSAKALGELTAHLEENSKELPAIDLRKGVRNSYKTRFGEIKRQIAKSIDNLLDCKVDFDAEQRELGFMQNTLKTFFRLLDIYRKNYALEKRAAGCIDFSDGERELYNKLSENGGDNDFRRQLSQRFKCVIVDEFQDCNNIQAKIFELLGEGRLFYVGDVKQSIYAFRGADPYIMAEICDNAYTEDNDYNSGESGDIKFKKLLLNTNFRSRKAVIDTVNAAFTGLMTPRYGGVDYAENNKLNPGAKYPPINDEIYDTEIAFVHSASQNDEDNEKSMALARYVARRIQELVDDENFIVCDGVDDNENFITRHARYSDFIVLLRAKTNINNYRKALKELNIPSTSKSGSGFFESDEIKLAWNYLKIIDNPLLDEAFIKVLMSPIYRFSAEEAAQIKLGLLGLEETDAEKRRSIAASYRGRSLFKCVNDCVSENALLNNTKINVKRSVSPKLQKFADDFKAFRYHMTSSSLTELVRKIYEDTELISIVAAFEDSPQRVGNIRQLQRMAASFESRGGGGLGDFLRFLERAAENASKGVEEAAQPEGGVNAVRIMTFHASKGLEAPVCIMSELQTKMIDDDYTGNLIVNYEHFMAMAHTDVKRRKKTKMLAYQALSKFIRSRELGSELRLLYVAMTRAQEKLIMVSTISDEDYKDLNKLVHDKSPLVDPELHEAIYEESSPFKCVFYSLMRHAPQIEKGKKEFALNDIACRVSAVEMNEKRDNDESVEESSDEITAEKEIPAEIPPQIPETKISALIERMNTKYAHTEDTIQQAKYSTTELAHKKEAKPIELTKPAFAKKGGVSGVEKGNAYHHCMEHFPLDSVKVKMDHETLLAAVSKVLEDMEKTGKITADELKIVEAERIAGFFESNLGKRMLNAYASDKDNVKREQSFYAEVNGNEVRLDYKGRISIQGRTDMYFIEDGKIVVVDYKSDTIENLEKERENYKFQVEIYTKVLGRYTGMEVKDMYLYAFTANSEYKVGS